MKNKFKDGHRTFEDTSVQITISGIGHLSAVPGHPSFVKEHVGSKFKDWVGQVDITVTHPHAAYSAFSHGLVHHWSYLLRTSSSISTMLKPLAYAIQQKFVPSLTAKVQLLGQDSVRKGR